LRRCIGFILTAALKSFIFAGTVYAYTFFEDELSKEAFMPEQIATTTGTLMSGLNAGFTRFMNFVPSFFGGLIILVVGWFVSKFVGNIIERLLLKMNLETVVAKAHISNYLPTTERGTKVQLSSIVGGFAKWFLFLIFVQAAAMSMGIVQVSVIINSIILFIPHILVAVAILVLGAWASRYFSGIVEASTSKMSLGSPNMPAVLVRYGILGFAVIAAISQLGIATNLINILFTGLVASLAIAFGLAFGLGGRHAASDLTRTWLNTSRSASPQDTKSGEKTGSDEPLSH
jgi:hypothetical protein